MLFRGFIGDFSSTYDGIQRPPALRFMKTSLATNRFQTTRMAPERIYAITPPRYLDILPKSVSDPNFGITRGVILDEEEVNLLDGQLAV